VTTNPLIAPMPAAWLGYKFDFTGEGELLVRVCCECADRREAEAEAARLKCRVSHGLCGPCYQKRMAEITGDRSE